MTTREDVLLQMGEIRYKKGDGTLYVMNERIAWIAENRDTVAVSHRFADIKMQKISPEGKPKVQLQVVLHDGNCSTFHFVNRNGLQAQLADRDKVKELLQKLLPNFKRKVDKELEEKKVLLTENPRLLQLYKDLVNTQVMNSEEFWATHAKEYKMKNVTVKQEIGVSGAFLADIKPQTDGCNGLKYNLTSDIIECIYKTYPVVKRKHQENVPSKMTEAEFWTKFFQSHYFHRDRMIGGTKDIFTECGKIDDQNLQAEIEKNVENPLLNLKEFGDLTLDEGYGTVENETTPINSGNIVHQNMIKRFNQHSMMVLKTMTNQNKENHNNKEDNLDDESQIPKKKQRIMEKISFEDLGAPVLMSDTQPNQQETDTIVLKNAERYFYGPTSSGVVETKEDTTGLDVVQTKLVQLTETWQHGYSAQKTLDSTAAVNALGELSPGGALMRDLREDNTSATVPPEYETELRSLYFTFTEVLKQYWSCYPLITIEREDKVKQMYEVLQRFKEVKLTPFENRVLRELAPLRAAMTTHLNSMYQAAVRKYLTWQENKKRHMR